MGNRITWVDTVKALGMILVFYGHYVEVISVTEHSTAAFWQRKLIYSFHMPLFFLIAGFFTPKRPINLPHLRKLFLSRILPVLIFCALTIPFWVYHYVQIGNDRLLKDLGEKIALLLRGNPQLNFPTWFLVCLFTTEVLAMLFRFPSQKPRTPFLWGLGFLLVGYFVCRYLPYFIYYLGIDKNVWYLHESLVALGFFLIGHALFPWIESLRQKRKWLFAVLLPVFPLLLIGANMLADPNRGVLMAGSFHGPLLPFLAGAFSGIGMIICLAILVPPNKVLSYLGRHTLILLGLNGFFHHFFNLPIFELFGYEDSWHWVLMNGVLVTSLSLLACVPFIWLLDRYVPQLMGRPYEKGPILGSLEGFSQRKGFKGLF